MKSRMDKYYKEEELMQRTSKNDALYDELYREKQVPRSNVTVLDNINEIDITKIRAMVDKREEYKKVRDYENIVNPIDTYRKREINYEFDEIDNSNYDINEILKKKRSDKVYKEDPDKIRRISAEYNDVPSFVEEIEERVSDEFTAHENQLKELFNTISRTAINEGTDLFSNLKEDDKSDKEEKENTFYTKTANFNTDDFYDDLNDESSSKVFIIIGIIAVVIAIGIIVWLKFFK